jgi:hypothetical protein
MIPLATYLKGGECIIADYTLEEKSKLDKTLVEFDVVNSQVGAKNICYNI